MLVYVCVCVHACVSNQSVIFFRQQENQALISSKQWSWAKSCVENTAERAKWTSLEKAADRAEITECYKAVGWNSEPSWTGN